MGPLSVSVDSAGTEPGGEMAGTDFAKGIEPGVEHTDVETELVAADIGGTEAECVEGMVIVVGKGFAPGFAGAISATSVVPAASVVVQVAAARSFASPVVLPTSVVPGPSASAAQVAAVQDVVSPIAAAEVASADVGTVVAGESAAAVAAAVADAFAEGIGAATGAALVAGSSQT
jgi:hypothetical protein